jgi:hypothetical protein
MPRSESCRISSSFAVASTLQAAGNKGYDGFAMAYRVA